MKKEVKVTGILRNSGNAKDCVHSAHIPSVKSIMAVVWGTLRGPGRSMDSRCNHMLSGPYFCIVEHTLERSSLVLSKPSDFCIVEHTLERSSLVLSKHSDTKWDHSLEYSIIFFPFFMGGGGGGRGPVAPLLLKSATEEER